MKVLMFNGSPHQKGCTYTALCEVKKELDAAGIESEIMWVGADAVRSCTACEVCKTFADHHCVIDDKVNEALVKARECDAYVFGSPVHYAAPAGAMIAFMGRFLYAKEELHCGKLGAAVVSCRRAGATAALSVLNEFITYGSIQPVASQYWNMVHGNRPEEVLQDAEGLQIMRTLGKNIAWRLKMKKLAEENGLEAPDYEERVFTNFIR